MNELEIALLDPTDTKLDTYIETNSNKTIRKHIEEIKNKASVSSSGGEIKKRLLEFVETIK